MKIVFITVMAYKPTAATCDKRIDALENEINSLKEQVNQQGIVLRKWELARAGFQKMSAQMHSKIAANEFLIGGMDSMDEDIFAMVRFFFSYIMKLHVNPNDVLNAYRRGNKIKSKHTKDGTVIKIPPPILIKVMEDLKVKIYKNAQVLKGQTNPTLKCGYYIKRKSICLHASCQGTKCAALGCYMEEKSRKVRKRQNSIRLAGPDLYLDEKLVVPDVIPPLSSNVFYLSDDQIELVKTWILFL